ncbi:signal peptidase I [Brevibacterium jeotgali]|uniref:Signal peptidase I n=1 Tax=Brevibacterium jeotgali TaxID=1262550 RepID=A0A2H1L2Z6_9MICO|nr:signal peptidase I [Brevibacterium jeotgali]TWC02480.1 signal peptidase I [Brevibacterium jeotgali]SMY11272.1 signal peptidase I [Brevibacterium jeotgali]
MHPSHDAHEGANRSTGSRPRASPGGLHAWLRVGGIIVLVAVVAAGLIRGVGVQTFTVPSASMSPTLQPGDRIVALRAPALLGTIERGDVIVFDGRGSFVGSLPPDMFGQMAAWFGIGPRDVYYVKRVIGVGGDTVQCCGDDGRLTVNDQPVDEPYVNDRSQAASGVEFAVEVPADSFWVMGDNRYDSTDSRDLLGRPGGGMIREDRVIGTVTRAR